MTLVFLDSRRTLGSLVFRPTEGLGGPYFEVNDYGLKMRPL